MVYTFSQGDKTVSSVKFQDARQGWCKVNRIGVSYWDGSAFKPVEDQSPSADEEVELITQMQEYKFTPVVTSKLQIGLRAPNEYTCAQEIEIWGCR